MLAQFLRIGLVVASHMLVQISGRSKRIRAIWEATLKWFIASMNSNMSVGRGRIIEMTYIVIKNKSQKYQNVIFADI